jgi:hypothetical protein
MDRDGSRVYGQGAERMGQRARGRAHGDGKLNNLSSDVCSLSSGIWLRGSICEVRGQGMVGMGSAYGAWRAGHTVQGTGWKVKDKENLELGMRKSEIIK